jgi:hypothetical protein
VGYIYKVCKNVDVEDEFHFVFVCPAYHMLRVKYIKLLYYKHPIVFKCIELMQSENVPVQCQNIAIYQLYYLCCICYLSWKVNLQCNCPVLNSMST